MKRFLIPILLLALLLAGCSGADTPPETEGNRDTTGRYALSDGGEALIVGPSGWDAPAEDNARVFYEIFVGSFSDSNGDGIGDLKGILNRIDYLAGKGGEGLGVEGLWLTPIFKSTTYHKYNVMDYYEVDPSFGTGEDLIALLDACHQRGVKVILDLPLNHTGTLCPWFQSFAAAHRNGDPEDPYYDFYSYYIRGESDPEAGHSYAQLAGTELMYECNFDSGMPELNFDSEAVRETVLEVAKHYLDLGVDGFRFDAAKYIYFGDNARSAAFWQWYIGELKRIKPEIYTVAEVWDGDGVTDKYYPALNCFDFTVSGSSGVIAQAAKAGDVNRYTAYVESYLARIRELNGEAMMVPFVANHDMDRAAGFLTVASGQMQMAANLYLLSPGSPFIYYGEELGMRGSRGGASTDANRRLKMEWGDGDTVKDPEGTTYAASNRAPGTFEEQKGDGDSLYSYYKRLIRLRRAYPAVARGEYVPLNLTGTKAGVFTAEWQGQRVRVVHNTSGSAVTLPGFEGWQIGDAIGAGSASLQEGTLTLEGQTSVILTPAE